MIQQARGLWSDNLQAFMAGTVDTPAAEEIHDRMRDAYLTSHVTRSALALQKAARNDNAGYL